MGHTEVEFDAQSYSRIMRALAAPVRFRIISLLRGGELSVGEIISQVDQESTSIPFHLRTLLTAGLVVREDRGRTHFYRLQPAVYQPGDRKTRPDRIDLGYCQIEFV